jgi:selenium metabolism protein YedF
VVLVRQALAEGGFELLEVVVDNEASRENLLKFAAHAHCLVEAAVSEGPETRLRLRPQADLSAKVSGVPQPEEVPMLACDAGPRTVVLITSDGIGKGDPDLAHLLLRGFLYTLAVSEVPPRRVILMNAGVKLAVEGSESLENLRKLTDRSVEVVSCGTCLDFYQLTDRLAVGGITNIYEIAEHLLQGPVVTL